MMSESDDTDSSDGTTSLFTDKELNINKAVSKKRQPFTRYGHCFQFLLFECMLGYMELHLSCCQKSVVKKGDHVKYFPITSYDT